MPTSRPDGIIFRRAITIYKCNAPKTKRRYTAGHPVRVAVNSMVGARRITVKGRKRQPTNRKHPMMEMLRGQVGRCGATIGGVGSGAASVGSAAPGEVLRPGGGGVAE